MGWPLLQDRLRIRSHGGDVIGEPTLLRGVEMRRLGALEQLVMEQMWARAQPATVREVLEGLLLQRPLAYTTVMTVMDNLRRKGILTRERHGRAYRYRATLSREQHTASLMEDVLHTGADRDATLLHFVEQMSAEEATRLREALDAHLGDARGAES